LVVSRASLASTARFWFRYKEKRSLPRLSIDIAKVGLASPPFECSYQPHPHPTRPPVPFPKPPTLRESKGAGGRSPGVEQDKSGASCTPSTHPVPEY
jgi:hypothetical protein